MSWKDCKITSLQIADKMLELGFVMDFSYKDEMHNRTTPDKPPMFGVTYKLGTLNVWRIQNGVQTANLINSHFTNHKPYKSMEDFIEYFEN